MIEVAIAMATAPFGALMIVVFVGAMICEARIERGLTRSCK